MVKVSTVGRERPLILLWSLELFSISSPEGGRKGGRERERNREWEEERKGVRVRGRERKEKEPLPTWFQLLPIILH